MWRSSLRGTWGGLTRARVRKVFDCARFFPCRPIRHGTMLPSLPQNEIGTSELDPFIAVEMAIAVRRNAAARAAAMINNLGN
jgi:hypothetical protein